MKGGCVERVKMGRFSGVAFWVSEFLWNIGVFETVVSGRSGNYVVSLAFCGRFLLGPGWCDRIYGVISAIR